MESNIHTRHNFLKKLSWTLVSLFSLGFISERMEINYSNKRNNGKLKLLSLDEANDKIRKNSFSNKVQIVPEPSPNNSK